MPRISSPFGQRLLAAALAFAACLASTGTAAADTQSSPADPSIVKIDSARFGISDGEIAGIRGQMQQAVDGGFLAGALLLVGNGDGVGLLETVGTQGPEDDTPVDAQTIFRIYSMTKPIISVAIMTLVEDGVIALDDPVEKYIPEFANLEVIDRETGETRPARNSISIENLLTHESGLIQAIFSPDSALGKRYASELRGDITAQEFAAKIGRLPVYFEPGTAWHYGHSTDVLGAVLEIATGQTLDVVLNERIFQPLGMDETTFCVPASKRDRIAEPVHGRMTDNTIPRKMLSGGGGLNSTTEDYVRFAQMLLNGGEYRGARIIEESTLDLMREPRIGNSVSREFYFYGERGDWGLGFHLQPTTDDPAGPHNFGWRGIGGTIVVVDEENDFFMLYMEQKRGCPQSPFNNNVAQQVVYEAIKNPAD